MSNEPNATETKKKEKLVQIGPIPFDPNNPQSKYLTISLNGEPPLMLERGERHMVPQRYADAYEHRVKMAGRKIKERERRARELREKQNEEGVKFM